MNINSPERKCFIFYCTLLLFDRLRRDAIAVERANKCRKFSLRYDNRRHESVELLLRYILYSNNFEDLIIHAWCV